VVLFSKDQTPVTRADLERFFEDPQADRCTWHSFEKIEKGHGRMLRRHLTTSPDLNDALRAATGARWDRSFARPRERTSRDKHSVEVVSGWTSQSHKQCCPQRLLALTRAHWAVENRLNFRRDATDGERMSVASACRPWLRCWPCSTR
jgi:hypothetical protein